jgi:hypothetical protein
MATGPTPAKSDQRSETLPVLPPGVIPEPRTQADPAPSAGSRRRRTVLIAVSAIVLAAAGVAVAVQATGPGTAVPAAQRSAADLGFLQIVRQQPGFAAVSDDSLIAIGHSLCGELAAGVSPDAVTPPPSAGQFSMEDISTAVGAAAGAYCPDQMARVAQPG